VSSERRLALELAGEPVQLLPERALLCPRLRTLFVADLHLGKAATFRASGIALPRGSTDADLARLAGALERTAAEHLVVLGDFLHAARGRVDALVESFARWRSARTELAVTVVRGNHDAHAGDPPAAWRVRAVDAPLRLGPFRLAHDPADTSDTDCSGDAEGTYTLSGHLHPGVRLRGRGGDSVRLPCFVVGTERAILPAFAGFTGLAIVRPQAGDRLVAIAQSRLFALPG
jgi:DNA ligase-associated metallophosphoesterase